MTSENDWKGESLITNVPKAKMQGLSFHLPRLKNRKRPRRGCLVCDVTLSLRNKWGLCKDHMHVHPHCRCDKCGP